MASAILIDRLFSFRLARSESVSSANPAAYMSMASSAVIQLSFEGAFPRISMVDSLTEVHRVATLERSVLAALTKLELLVSADLKLVRTSADFCRSLHGIRGAEPLFWLRGRSSVDSGNQIFLSWLDEAPAAVAGLG